jgi:hypothetical protein
MVIEMEPLPGETHSRYLPVPGAENPTLLELKHDRLPPERAVAAHYREPMLQALLVSSPKRTCSAIRR